MEEDNPIELDRIVHLLSEKYKNLDEYFADENREKKLKQFHLGTQDQFRGFWLSNADLLHEEGIYL